MVSSERIRLGLGLTFALVGLLSPSVIDALWLWWGGIYCLRRALRDEDVRGQKEHGRAEERSGPADVTAQEKDEGAHDLTDTGERTAETSEDEDLRHIDRRVSPSEDFSIVHEELEQSIQKARIDYSGLDDDIEVDCRGFNLHLRLSEEPEDADEVRRRPNPFFRYMFDSERIDNEEQGHSTSRGLPGHTTLQPSKVTENDRSEVGLPESPLPSTEGTQYNGAESGRAADRGQTIAGRFCRDEVQERNTDSRMPSIRMYDSGAHRYPLPHLPRPQNRPFPPLPPPRYIGEELREGQDPGWQWGNMDSPTDVGFSGNRLSSVKPGSSLLGGARSSQAHARERPGENVFSPREPSTSRSLDDMSSADSQEHSDEDRSGKPWPTLANHRFTSEMQLGQRALEMSSRRYGEEQIRLMTKYQHTMPDTFFAHDHAGLDTPRTDCIPSLQDLSVLNTESQASQDKTINPWECESEPNPVIFRHLRGMPAVYIAANTPEACTMNQTQCSSSVGVQVETPVELVSSCNPLTQSAVFQMSLDDSWRPPQVNPQQFASIKASTTREALQNQCEVDEEGSLSSYVPLPAEAASASSSPPTSVSSVSIQTIVCKKCHVTFSSQDDCSMHLKRKRCRRYACDVCPAKYHLRADLRRHKHTVHRDQYPSSNVFVCQNPRCSMPNKKFIRKDNFERHVRTCFSRIEATNQLV